MTALLAVAACGTSYALRHRVRGGEDLRSVAARYGVSERELRDFNGLEEGDRLRPGDVLFVPGAVRPSRARPVASPSPPPPSPPRAGPSPRSAPAPELPPARVASPSPPTAAGRAENGTARLHWPVEGAVLRGFGTGPAGESRGIDIAASRGTPVRAAAGGTVTYAGVPAPAYGPLIIVEHPGDLYSVYANLVEGRVRKGQAVEPGQVIATSGGGDGDLPPHLHFEARRGERPVDPLLFLPPH